MTPATKKLKLDEARLILHRRLEAMKERTGVGIWPTKGQNADLRDLSSLINDGLTTYLEAYDNYYGDLDEEENFDA